MTSPFNAVRPLLSISYYPYIGNEISSTTRSHAVMFGCEGMIANVTRHDENPKPPNISPAKGSSAGAVAGGVISGIVVVVIVGGICFVVIVAFGISRKKRVIDFQSTRMETIIAANSEAETKVTEKGALGQSSFETPSAYSQLQYNFQQATSGNGSTTVAKSSSAVAPQSTTAFESDTDDISTQDLVDVGST